MLSPEERRQRARIAAHSMHSRHDTEAVTAHGREAFLKSFEAQVDPEGTLTPEERARRAQHALKAHMARLSLQSARARRARKEASNATR